MLLAFFGTVIALNEFMLLPHKYKVVYLQGNCMQTNKSLHLNLKLKMKKNLILAIAITFITTLSVQKGYSQTKEEAVVDFNSALELSKTDLSGAVAKMQEVLKKYANLGAEADSLKIKAGKVLPVWQFNIGNNLMKDKNFDKAIEAYVKSDEMATLYKDDNIKEKTENQLVKLYTNKGNMLLKAEKADSAILILDKAVALDSEYSKALFARGQAFKKKGDDAKMKENMDLAIASASKVNDTVTVKAAKSAIGINYYQDAKAAFTKKAYGEAVEKLNSALGYEYKNKELYYLLATSNNSLKNFDQAIEAATTGVAMEEQTNEKMARFYYEIAKAYEGKKDVANACANYKKAAFGTYAASANYQMKTVLKCQ
jgi:tetratricopeptide (TPR) repeat protein